MGDKGGKKDKNKSRKQKISKQEQEAKKKQDKQHKSTMWKESGCERAKTTIPDALRFLIVEHQEDIEANERLQLTGEPIVSYRNKDKVYKWPYKWSLTKFCPPFIL